MKRTFKLAAAALGALASISSAAYAVALTQPGEAAPGMLPAQPPVLAQPGACQGFAVAQAFIAIQGPNGVSTLPMTQVGPHAFQIARQPDWPATGHIRLIWAPLPSAPAGVLGAVDVGSDPVLLDGAPVAEAFVGGQVVATAIQTVSLDPAVWPHVVSLQIGSVPAGSGCATLGAVPATLTVLPTPIGVPPIDPSILIRNGDALR